MDCMGCWASSGAPCVAETRGLVLHGQVVEGPAGISGAGDAVGPAEEWTSTGSATGAGADAVVQPRRASSGTETCTTEGRSEASSTVTCGGGPVACGAEGGSASLAGPGRACWSRAICPLAAHAEEGTREGTQAGESLSGRWLESSGVSTRSRVVVASGWSTGSRGPAPGAALAFYANINTAGCAVGTGSNFTILR